MSCVHTFTPFFTDRRIQFGNGSPPFNTTAVGDRLYISDEVDPVDGVKLIGHESMSTSGTSLVYYTGVTCGSLDPDNPIGPIGAPLLADLPSASPFAPSAGTGPTIEDSPPAGDPNIGGPLGFGGDPAADPSTGKEGVPGQTGGEPPPPDEKPPMFICGTVNETSLRYWCPEACGRKYRTPAPSIAGNCNACLGSDWGFGGPAIDWNVGFLTYGINLGSIQEPADTGFPASQMMSDWPSTTIEVFESHPDQECFPGNNFNCGLVGPFFTWDNNDPNRLITTNLTAFVVPNNIWPNNAMPVDLLIPGAIAGGGINSGFLGNTVNPPGACPSYDGIPGGSFCLLMRFDTLPNNPNAYELYTWIWAWPDTVLCDGTYDAVLGSWDTLTAPLSMKSRSICDSQFGCNAGSIDVTLYASAQSAEVVMFLADQ